MGPLMAVFIRRGKRRVSHESSFAELMQRLDAGDARAADQIYKQFATRLIALARNHLDGRLKAVEDPEDVIQSVFKSFFPRYKEGQFDLRSRDSLWGLLATITLRKCGHRIEHYLAARRDVRRQETPRTAPDGSPAGWELIAREPTPQEAAMLSLTLEEVMRDFQEHHRKIVQLILQGSTPDQAATEAGCTQRTVHRVLQRLRRRLERLAAEDIRS
jgi:RNA polymerase sigma-70 factor (ECF subfamily)